MYVWQEHEVHVSVSVELYCVVTTEDYFYFTG